MKAIDLKRDWQTLVSYLPANFEDLAREHKLLNTQWPNAKVKTAEALLQLILLHVGADLPLRQTVATVAERGGPDVTQVWLHQKMRRAQPFLAALVQAMTSEVQREASSERWAGYEMVCLDGTVVCGPAAEGTDARIHAVLRLHDLRVLDVRVTGAEEGETLRRFFWMGEQLVIVDRGYCNAAGIARVVAHGADVLVRLNRGALPLYDAAGNVVDALDWCRSLVGRRVTERAVHIVHKVGRQRTEIPGRLVAVRLPDKEAEEARVRVRREHGRDTTPEQLEAAGYVMLFTTAPSQRLSATRCAAAYRLRWQVELQIKRWKSLCHFDLLPNYRDDTIRSWLTGKVLLGLLLDRIGSDPQPATSRPLARQAWKLTAIAWPLIVGALLPLRMAHAAESLPAIADHLDHLDGRFAPGARPRQIDAFRLRLVSHSGTTATKDY